MPQLERVSFEDLPAIGDEPLEPAGLISMMHWAIDRGRFIKTLKQEVREAGDDLDKLWGEEPELLIGDLDRPSLTRFMPSRVYGTASAFGLRTAQLAAYGRLYHDRLSGLNDGLANHFEAHETRMGVIVADDAPGLGVGTFELHGEEWASWGNRVKGASGLVVGVDVRSATVELEALDGRHFGARLLPNPMLDGQPDWTEYLDVAMRYPAQRTTA